MDEVDVRFTHCILCYFQAHREVSNLLLQVLDEGHLTDVRLLFKLQLNELYRVQSKEKRISPPIESVLF